MLSSGTVIAQMISVVASPIVTRIYSPDHFGVLAVFVSIISIIAPLATLRYSIAIPIANDEESADDILRLTFSVISINTCILVVCILVFRSLGFSKLNDVLIQPYLWFLPITFFSVGVIQALTNWSIREKDFKLLASIAIQQGACSAGSKIGLGLLGIQPFGLLAGYYFSQTAGIWSVTAKLFKSRPGILKNIRYQQLKAVAIRYRRFPLIQGWSQFLLAFSTHLPALFIAGYYGPDNAGLYSLAVSMISMPMNILGQSVGQVYFSEIASYGKEQPQKILTFTTKLLRRLFFVGLIPGAIILAFGPILFKLIFGEVWCEAGVYARLLSALVVSRFLLMAVAHSLNVLEKQVIQVYINLFQMLLVTIIFVFSGSVGLSARMAILIYGLGLSLYYFLVLFYIRHLLQGMARKDRKG